MSAAALLDTSAVLRLREKVSGAVLLSGDPGYDESRHVFNAMIDRRPAVVVRPANQEDIRRAVDFAREQELPVAVKGGGHNVAGSAVCDGGLVIDNRELRDVHVDADTRRAVAQ